MWLRRLGRWLFPAFLLLCCAIPVGGAPWWEVHFTQGSYTATTPYEQAIADFIQTATDSVWVTSYTWGNSSHNLPIEAINSQYGAGLDVRVIGDNAQSFNSYMAGYEKRTDASASDPGDLMHNKLIILDYGTGHARVMTGSTNWTDPAYSSQNNDILIIRDNEVAECYGREFLELWNGNYRSGPTDQHEYTVSGHSVEVYFAPEDDPGETYLTNLLNNAQRCIFFLSFNHRLSDHMYACINLKNAGGVAEGVYESIYSDMLTTYLASDIDVREKGGSDRMHHKVYIVDLETVATGSLNHSNISSSYTDENVVFVHDFRLAREYMKEFRDVMRVATAQSANPTFEENAPADVTNLAAVDTPNDDGQSITVSWNPSAAADLAGYYVYISTTPITSVEDLVPELFVQSGVSTAITTYNQDDPISDDVDYYIAVSAVDWHGNENYNCPTVGPVRSSGLVTGAQPSGSLIVSDTSSNVASETAALTGSITNGVNAVSAIHTMKFSFGDNSGGHAFQPLPAAYQSPPEGWQVISVTDTELTIQATSSAYDIAIGSSLNIYLAVLNPPASGYSNPIYLYATAANGEEANVVELSPGILISAPTTAPDANLAWGTGATRVGGENDTVTLSLQNDPTASARIKQVTVAFGTTNTAFDPRAAAAQVAPAGWSVAVSGEQVSFTATDTSYYISPGAMELFPIAVLNPGISGSSEDAYVSVIDEYDQQVMNLDAGSLTVLASNDIVINEIMYNPSGTDVYYEWVEIYNRSSVAVDLSNWTLNCGGAVTTLPSGTSLAPYGFLVVASTLSRGSIGDVILESFATRYGDQDGSWVVNASDPLENYEVIEGTDFNLNDDSDYVTLTSDDGTYTVTVVYNDANALWQGADGFGSSLEKQDPAIDDSANFLIDGQNWDASAPNVTYPYGTPGATNGAAGASVPPVTGLYVGNAGLNAITLNWTALSNYNSFSEYRIYYGTATPVSAASAVWDSNDDPAMGTISTASTTITNLNAGQAYYFRLVAVSSSFGVGDVASATEVAAATSTTDFVTVRAVNDGVNSITLYDGSQTLRDEGANIDLLLAGSVSGTNPVAVWYDVGSSPDGASAGNPNDRVVYAAGNGVTWDAVIPAQDPEVVDGATVQFIVSVEGQNYYRFGSAWMYKVDGGISASFTDLAAVGVGKGSVELRWTPPGSVADFDQYRVYYTSQASDTITVDDADWDAAQDYRLGQIATNSTIVTGLLAGAPYRFKVVAVDRYGNESSLTDCNEAAAVTKTGTVIITEVAPEGDTAYAAVPWVELYCAEGSQDMTGYNLTDLDGNTVAVGAVTMNAGEYRVVTFPTVGMLGNEDQVALDSDMDTTNGGYIDAVVWTDNDGAYSAGELDDVARLRAANWEFHSVFQPGQEAMAEAFSVPYTASCSYSISRKWSGGYGDRDLHLDWQTQYVPGAGMVNGMDAVTLTGFSDGVTSRGSLDGYIYLQDTGVTVDFVLSSIPQDSSSVTVYYTIDAVPTGDPFGSDTPVAMTSTTDLYNWTATIPGSVDPATYYGRTVNFIVVVDGIPYTNYNVPWRYRLDGRVPTTVTGFRILGTTEQAATVSWDKLTNMSDFATYRVYYTNTPPLTVNDSYFDAGSDPLLGSINTSGITLTGLTSSETFTMAIVGVDDAGNVGALSNQDTAVMAMNQSVSSLSLTDTASNSVTTGFAGTDRLRAADITVGAWFTEQPVTPPVMWFDAGEAPDGPGGSNTGDRQVTMSSGGDPRYWTATLPYTDTDVVHDTVMQIIFEINGTTISNSANNQPFKYLIDETAGESPVLLGTGGDSATTTVTIGWVGASYHQFAAFEVYYAIGTSVSTADAAWTKAKDATLAIPTTTGTSIRGLNQAETYTFGVVWRDDVGNASPLSGTVTLYTNNMVPADDPAYDGVNVAHVLDGTESLLDTDITVVMILDAAPSVPGSAKLYYDVGDQPDGPGGANENERVLTLSDNPDGNPYTWSCVIPGDDPEVVDGAQIRYVAAMDGFVLTNHGNPYAFNIDSTPPPGLSSAAHFDFGTHITLTWSPVGTGDFAGYRVYYNTAYPASAGTMLTAAQEPTLNNNQTAGLTIYGLSAAANYFINVAVVDAVGNETLLPQDIVVYRQAPGAATTMEYNAGYAYGHGEVYAGDDWEFSVLLKDAGGLPVPGETVTFSVTAGDGTFGGAPSVDAVSGLDGIARGVMTTSRDASIDNYATASHATLGTVSFIARATAKPPTALRIINTGGAAGVESTLTVEALDAAGNRDTSYYGKVILVPVEQGVLVGSFNYTSEFMIDTGVGSITVRDNEMETVHLTAKDWATGLVTDECDWDVGPGVPARVELLLPVSAEAGSAVAVTAGIYDAWGNLCANDNNTTVTLNSTGSAYGPVLGHAVPVSGGELTTTLTDMVAETITVTASSAGMADYAAALAYTPAAPAKLVTTPYGSTSAGNSLDVTVAVRDMYGNQVVSDSGRTVTLSADGSATIAVPDLVTDGGAAVFAVANDIAEDVALTPSATGLTPVSGIASFVPATPARLTVTAPATMTCGSSAPVTVRIEDSHGNLIRDNSTAITLEIVTGTAVGGTVTAVDGIATLTLSGTVANEISIRATGGGLASPAYTVTLAPADAAALAVSGPATATAGASVELLVEVRDAYGNLVAGDSGREIGIAGTGALTASAATELTGGGRARFTVSDNIAEAVTATVSSTGLPDVQHSLTIAPGAVAKLALAAPSAVTCGNDAAVTVRIEDALGNLIDSDNSTNVQLWIGDNAEQSSSVSAGVVSFTLHKETAGNITVTATADSLAASPVAVALLSAAPAQLAVTAPAGGEAGSDIEVQLDILDQYGNLVAESGRTVTIAGSGSLTAPASVTTAAGEAGFIVSDAVAETVSVTLSSVGLPDASASLAIAPAAAQRLTLAIASSGTCGAPVTATVTLEDNLGNIITSDNSTAVTLAVTSGSAAGRTATLSAGQATIELTGTVAEAVTVEGRTATLASPSRTVTLTPAAPAQLAIVPLATTAAAGSSIEGTIEVRDSYGNLVAADNGREIALSVDGSASLAAAAIGTAGGVVPFTVTDRTAEGITLTAATPGLAAASQPLTFTVGTAAQIAVSAPASGVCGTAVAIPVALQDALGNVITSDDTTTVTLQVVDGNATGSSVQLSAGQGTLQLNSATAGLVGFTISDGGLVSSGRKTMVMEPAAAAELLVTLSATSATVGDTITGKVKVVDQYGNVVSAGSRALALEVTNNAMLSAAQIDIAQGYADFTVSDRSAEASVLSLTAVGLTQYVQALTFVPGALARLAVTAPSTALCGSPATLDIALVDAQGNLLADDNSTVVAATSSRGTVSGAGAVSGGRIQLQVSTTVPGDLTVTARSGDVSAPVTIQVLPAAPHRLELTAPTAIIAGNDASLGVRVRDEYGNLVTTDNSTVVDLAVTGSATAANGVPVTVTGGQVALQVTDAQAETVVVSISASGLNGDNAVVQFNPSNAAAVVALLPRNTMTIDDTTVCTVEIRDAYGNVNMFDNSSQVALQLPAGLSCVEANPQTVREGRAQFTVSSNALGRFILTPQSGVLPATAAQLDCIPGAVRQVRLLGPASAAAGDAVQLAVALEDRLGNLVTDDDRDVTVSLTGSATTPAAATPVTTSNGQATLTVTDNTAEQVTVTPVSAGLEAVAAAITFASGSTDRLELVMPSRLAYGAALPLTVTARDQYGNRVAISGEIQIAVDRGTVSPAVLTPVDGQATAELTLSVSGMVTVTASGQGLTASAAVTVEIPPATAATVNEEIGNGRTVTFRVPATVASDSCFVMAQPSPDQAGYNLGGVVGAVMDLVMVDAVSSDTLTDAFNDLVTVEFSYPDADQDGLVDGTNYNENDLRLYRWENDAWVLVDDGGRNEVDAGRNVVIADLIHFSEYGIRISSDTATAGGEIFVYPNPWKPEYAEQRVVFANIPQNVSVRIKIFNIAGELIVDRELTLTGTQMAEWDLRNESGRDVASGIYLYHISGGGVNKTGKIAIIR